MTELTGQMEVPGKTELTELTGQMEVPGKTELTGQMELMGQMAQMALRDLKDPKERQDVAVAWCRTGSAAVNAPMA